MALPKVQTSNRDFQLLQSTWASQLDPLLSQPLSKSLLLKEVSLTTGDNVINHRLGRKLQGWLVVDRDGAADIYRSAPKNDLTLVLNSSAPIIVDLLVF